MSILSYFLLLLLFCISMHACEARNNIGFGHKGFGAPPQHSGKGLFQQVVEKLRLGMDSSSKGISEQVKKEDDGTQGGAIILTSQDTKKYSMRTTHHDVKGVMKYSSRSGGRKSGVVSVSWSVPRKNNREKNSPGFYSDYSRPRTRPPSHN